MHGACRASALLSLDLLGLFLRGETGKGDQEEGDGRPREAGGRVGQGGGRAGQGCWRKPGTAVGIFFNYGSVGALVLTLASRALLVQHEKSFEFSKCAYSNCFEHSVKKCCQLWRSAAMWSKGGAAVVKYLDLRRS